MTEKRSRPTIHIINKFAQATGGSEQRALRLAELLAKRANVKIWATHPPDKALLERSPINTIDLRRLRFPRSGTFVFVGCYLHIGRWIRFARPSRRIVILNTKNPEELSRMVEQISPSGKFSDCEIVYSDESLKALVGRPGVVHQSPIDIERFQPSGDTHDPGEFCVGRLSRDYRYKFNERDPALFETLARSGINVRLMGANSIADELNSIANIELLKEGSVEPARFLNSLDAFIYRTSDLWRETFGRVVFEAMACGVPVVCGTNGGYSKFVRSGSNGFLFDSNDEAVEILSKLRQDIPLRNAIGIAGRATVEKMYSAEFEQDLLSYYVGA